MAMFLFIATFLGIYGAINYYCFRLIDRSLKLGKIKRFLFLILFFIMTISPIIMGIILRKGYSFFVKELAWITYNYLAFITLLFCVSICFKGFMFIFKGRNDPYKNLKFSSFFALLLCFYGYYEANKIKIENVEVYTNKIAKDYKIGFLSDLHHGHTVSDEYVNEIIKKLNDEKIDLLLLGGDILETGWNNNASIWRNINPSLGKYAVSGNHEFYLGYEKAKKIFSEMGFTLIDNKSVDIGDIRLIGLPDEVYVTQYGGKIEDIKMLIKNDIDHKFTILLKHRPRKVDSDIVDLQLSGHTHKGQLLPFSIVTKIFYPIHSGLYDIDNKYKIYVSRGIGTWGPRIRIASRPEITIINLKKSVR